MKTLKSTKGFTLVELIVVIAILGILAAVAVPAYSGYISKAKEAADMEVLSSINTAAQGTIAGKGQTVSKITVTCGSSDGKITAIAVEGTGSTSASYADLKLLLTGKADGSLPDLTSAAYAKGAIWTPANATAGTPATWAPKS